MPGDLFQLKGELNGEAFELGFASIVEFLEDEGLRSVVDKGASFVLWSGQNRITGRPIGSYQELRERVVSNASMILGRLL